MAFSSTSVGFLLPSPRAPAAVLRSTPQRLASASMSSSDGDPIREWILGPGGATKITRISPIGGGCINTANRYDTDAASFFVKTNRDIESSMFEAEAAGLDAMYRTNTIRVPKPLKTGSLRRGGSFIIMEYIDFGGSTLHGQRELGKMLGKMHKAGTSGKGFGFEMDNTIGSTPQPNPWTSDWITFFRDHRIGHQLELLLTNYNDHQIYEKGKKLLNKIPYLLRDIKDVKPSLLHGDLWSGNLAYDKEGKPVILDPACYYGHNEAEFGMSWCASFSSSFYDAYFEEMPKQKGFDDRLHLYKLYHYMNHYNLFGSSYRPQCISIMGRYNNQL